MSRLKYDVQFVERPPFTVAGVRNRVKIGDDAVMDAWDDFLDLEERIAGRIETGVYYSVAAGYEPDTLEYDCLVGVEVDDEQEAPEGLAKWSIPHNTYAVFTTTVRGIGRMYQLIYNEWLPASEYEHSPGPDFEYYDKDYDASLPNSLMYLYIPVQRK